MENAIREGELKLLQSETSGDLIVSCRDRKLTAHKLMLSIASPVLQELLLHDSTDTAVLIFPDVEGRTMSLVLDYIYNGSVTVAARDLQEFLDVSALLQLQLDRKGWERRERRDFPRDEENKSEIPERVQKKMARKVPNLMPIASLQKVKAVARKGLYNRVFPSPWCPRVVPLLADPREDYSATKEQVLKIPHTIEDKHVQENDTNNNFQIHPLSPYISQPISRGCPKKETQRRYVAPASSSLVETEDEKNVFCKNEAENEFAKIDLKTEDEDVVQEATNSPRTSETDEEAIKNENKTNKCKPFKCQDCGKAFSQLRNYKYHRSIHEGTKEFAARCPECGKIFNDRGYLSSHMKIHRDRKEYACPNCPKRFNQRVAYNMHLRIHTGLKPHECPICGKTFSRKMLLKQHQRVHTGERPYSCPECGKSFADRSNMSLHARLHTGVKPYACNLCPKTFTKKHHLKTHMNFHTGLKPYSCQKCGLSFSQSSNMRTHYKKCVLKSSPTQTVSENL